jgi:hypothetical protein
MKTAAERYAEAERQIGGAESLRRPLMIAAIEAAVAEERALWRSWLDRMQKLQALEIEEDFDPAPDKREANE